MLQQSPGLAAMRLSSRSEYLESPTTSRTESVGTPDWLRASRNLTLSAHVQEDSASESAPQSDRPVLVRREDVEPMLEGHLHAMDGVYRRLA